MTETFEGLGIQPKIADALAKQAIRVPTAIQRVAIPLLLEKKDAYLQAETGTGKTLAYVLPIFAAVDPLLPNAQAIIIAPTYELAIQIQRQCTDLAQHSGSAVRTILLIGGTSQDRQIEKLKKKPHIVVGSLGRIRELVDSRKLKVHMVRTLVLDEADRLLTLESKEDFEPILKATPQNRQLVFVSATDQPETNEIILALAPDIQRIHTAKDPVNSNIEHQYLVCEERDKAEMLRKLLYAMKPERTIVFVHKSQDAEFLANKLEHHKIKVADIHGTLHKEDRKQAMDQVRGGKVDVLIASDLAARGLDVKGLSHVVNFDVPSTSDAYLHRVGRCGRAGAEGHALSLVSEEQLYLMERFTRDLGIHLTEVRLREGVLSEVLV